MRGMTAELLQSGLFVISAIMLLLVAVSHEGEYAIIAVITLILFLIVGIIGMVDAVVLKERIYSTIYEWAIKLQSRLHPNHNREE